MSLDKLKKLIKQGEGQEVEFKTSFGKEAIETIVAFANTKGGTVIIGVNDCSEIVGTSVSDETLKEWLNQVKTNTEDQHLAGPNAGYGHHQERSQKRCSDA